jgi:hypothetical protein
MDWRGPREEDLTQPDGDVLKAPVPGERWPYGPPTWHQDCCTLHHGGLFCDCDASDASADDVIADFLSTDDDWEELTPCPDCGSLIGADETCCTACGMAFEVDGVIA